MRADVAELLTSDAGADALELAGQQADPASLAAASALREKFSPELAAAALEQVALRRRARAKLGPVADTLFLTRDGLEQATRPAVSAYRARAMVDSGVTRVVDLTCGLGLDARAFAEAGLVVEAIEQDAATAILARANLAGSAEVREADARTVESQGRTAFLDPARRTGAGRSWRLADLTPPWDFVRAHLQKGAWAKLGPGLPHREIPEGCAAEWIQADGDLVEVQLRPGQGRSAVLLDSRADHPVRIDADDTHAPACEPGEWIAEPDPAVIRAGALGAIAARTGLARVAPDIAYLTGDRVDHPGLTWFRIVEALPYRLKDLKAWVRSHGVGTVEIKKRGVDVDPAQLRRALKPKGVASATLIVTPTSVGSKVSVRVFVVERP